MNALNKLMGRFRDAGWADRFVAREGVFDIGFTELGDQRMQQLRAALFTELRPLSRIEMDVLIGLLSHYGGKGPASEKSDQSPRPPKTSDDSPQTDPQGQDE